MFSFPLKLANMGGMSLKDRLKEAIAISGKERPELAKEIGVSTAAIAHWLSGGTLSLKATSAANIEKATGVSATWIVTGEGPKMAAEKTNVAAAAIGVTKVPLISYVQAGIWSEASDPYAIGNADDWLMADQKVSSSAFALEIKGNSMLPKFEPGDRVIIDPSIAPQPGDFVVAKNGDNEATFKKYRPRGTNEHGQVIFELVPLNEDYPSMRSDTEQIHIIGTMVEHHQYRKRS